MPVVPVLTPGDPRLDDYRLLRDGELLRDRGLFVAEGRLVVERVLRDSRYRVKSLLLNTASHAALDRAGLLAADPVVYECATAAFADITGVNLHRGCLALVQRPHPRSWSELAADARSIVVLEAVTDADNVGGVFRNAAAFGVDAVLLGPGCCDPLYRKAVRTSMAAAVKVPFARIEPWPRALDTLRASGFIVAALTPRQPSVPLDDFDPPAGSRLALLVGTEGDGLTESAAAAADVRVRIPMRSDVDSLNLAVATGIALSRLARGL